MDAPPVERTLQVAIAHVDAQRPRRAGAAGRHRRAHLPIVAPGSARVGYPRLWGGFSSGHRSRAGLVVPTTANLTSPGDLSARIPRRSVRGWLRTYGAAGVTLPALLRILGRRGPYGIGVHARLAVCEDREAVPPASRGPAMRMRRSSIECGPPALDPRRECSPAAAGRRRVGTLQDITERKQADQAPRAAAAAFETNDGIVVCDANRIIQQVNRNRAHHRLRRQRRGGRPARVLQSGRHDAASLLRRHVAQHQGHRLLGRRSAELAAQRGGVSGLAHRDGGARVRAR